MGQYGGRPVKTPLAFQLCQAYEQQSGSTLRYGGAKSIWHHVTLDEVVAIGMVVSRWAQGRINGREACRKLQDRVLRGPPAASSGRDPAAGAQPGTGTAGGAAAPSNEIFAMMDSAFLHCNFSGAHALAMNELGIAAAVARPSDVRTSFRREARAILRSVPQQQQQQQLQQSQDAHLRHQRPHQQPCRQQRLDLVRLCLCVEIVHNLQRSHITGFTGLPGLSAVSEREVLQGAGDKRRQRKGLTLAEMDRYCPKGRHGGARAGDCPICMEPLAAGEACRTLPCSHALHQGCCEAWLARGGTCPMCRCQVDRS